MHFINCGKLIESARNSVHMLSVCNVLFEIDGDTYGKCVKTIVFFTEQRAVHMKL